MAVEGYRVVIRNLTSDILKLVAKRNEVAEKLSVIKLKHGKCIEDNEQEAKVIESVVSECAALGIPRHDAEILANALMEVSKNAQKRHLDS